LTFSTPTQPIVHLPGNLFPTGAAISFAANDGVEVGGAVEEQADADGDGRDKPTALPRLRRRHKRRNQVASQAVLLRLRGGQPDTPLEAGVNQIDIFLSHRKLAPQHLVEVRATPMSFHHATL
jgi:hypothetical protein